MKGCSGSNNQGRQRRGVGGGGGGGGGGAGPKCLWATHFLTIVSKHNKPQSFQLRV